MKDALIAILTAILGFISGMVTMEVILIVSDEGNKALNSIHKMWVDR